MIVDDAPDAVHQPLDFEVDQQPCRLPGETHIRDRLREVYRKERLYGLHLHDHYVLYEDVDEIRPLEAPPAILDAQRNSRHTRQATILKFPDKRRNIRSLEEARPERLMDRDTAANDLAGNVVGCLWISHAPVVAMTTPDETVGLFAKWALKVAFSATRAVASESQKLLRGLRGL